MRRVATAACRRGARAWVVAAAVHATAAAATRPIGCVWALLRVAAGRVRHHHRLSRLSRRLVARLLGTAGALGRGALGRGGLGRVVVRFAAKAAVRASIILGNGGEPEYDEMVGSDDLRLAAAQRHDPVEPGRRLLHFDPGAGSLPDRLHLAAALADEGADLEVAHDHLEGALRRAPRAAAAAHAAAALAGADGRHHHARRGQRRGRRLAGCRRLEFVEDELDGAIDAERRAHNSHQPLAPRHQPLRNAHLAAGRLAQLLDVRTALANDCSGVLGVEEQPIGDVDRRSQGAHHICARTASMGATSRCARGTVGTCER